MYTKYINQTKRIRKKFKLEDQTCINNLKYGESIWKMK